jgi:DNA-directed RNA polymerase specialized sigma24 family protein
MTQDTGITDEELEQLFHEPDRRFAVQMLDTYRREHMWRYILSKCRYFDDDDIHEVYTQTLSEFIECAKKPDFDPKAPLRLFQFIARFRAIDRARKRKRARVKDVAELIEPLAVDLKDTKVSLEWNLMMKEEKAAFRKALDKAVDELAPKQRIAALAMLEVYDQVRSDDSPKALAARIREMTGEDCTASKAADRWEAARENLRSKMTKAGFKHLFEDMQ